MLLQDTIEKKDIERKPQKKKTTKKTKKQKKQEKNPVIFELW